MNRSRFKNNYFALRQGRTRSESAVYTTVHEHRGTSPNAVLEQKSIFETTSNLSAKAVVDEILKNRPRTPIQPRGQAFAPTNIALCKYWGKRDAVLNLPVTNSLSLSLGDCGATTTIYECEQDSLQVNHQEITTDSPFKQRLNQFLDLVRLNPQTHYRVETQVNVPIAAGLASSACGFAALVLALNQLYGWDLSLERLSILARLGSGSASRSLWHGFVEWVCGEAKDGMDSVGKPIDSTWTALRFGLLIIDDQQKPLSSRLAMQKTQQTSVFYDRWPNKVNHDLDKLKTAIAVQDFTLLGETAESNAQAMHALMMTARPSIVYTLPETQRLMQLVWTCRSEGLSVYFTQDAGPNLKLLFLEQDAEEICRRFPGLKVVVPFPKEAS